MPSVLASDAKEDVAIQYQYITTNTGATCVGSDLHRGGLFLKKHHDG
jgi:hypothetical protein